MNKPTNIFQQNWTPPSRRTPKSLYNKVMNKVVKDKNANINILPNMIKQDILERRKPKKLHNYSDDI